MARIFSYHDTHLHRIGPNYEQLPINRPQCPVHSYNKDGQMTYHHAGDQPVYAPNSYGGPAADPAKGAEIGWDVERGRARAHGVREARRRRRLLPAGHARARGDGRRRARGARRRTSSATPPTTCRPRCSCASIAYWTRVDEQIGARVAAGLGHANGSSPSQELRAAQELVDSRAGTA